MGSIFAFGKKWRYAHMATLVEITGRRFAHHSTVLAAAWQAAPAATDTATGRVKLAVEGLDSQVRVWSRQLSQHQLIGCSFSCQFDHDSHWYFRARFAIRQRDSTQLTGDVGDAGCNAAAASASSLYCTHRLECLVVEPQLGNGGGVV